MPKFPYDISFPHPREGYEVVNLLEQFWLGRRLAMAQFQRLLGVISAAVAVVPLGFLGAQPLQR